MRLILILSFFISTFAQAALQPNAVGTINIGGLTMTTTGLKILQSNVNAGGARASFVDVSLGLTSKTTSYVVPSAKTFALYAIKIILAYAGTGSQGVYLDCADNDVGSNGTATAFTNPKGMFTGNTGGTEFSDFITWNGPGAGLTGNIEIPHGGSCPTGKYPSQTYGAYSGAATVILYGYEI